MSPTKHRYLMRWRFGELYEEVTPVENQNLTLSLSVGFCEAQLLTKHLPQSLLLFLGFCEVRLLYLQLMPDQRLERFGRWNELLRYLNNLFLNQMPS